MEVKDLSYLWQFRTQKGHNGKSSNKCCVGIMESKVNHSTPSIGQAGANAALQNFAPHAATEA